MTHRPPRVVEVLVPRFADRLAGAAHRREVRTYGDLLAVQAEERSARVAEDLRRAQRVPSRHPAGARSKLQPRKRP